MKFLILIFGVTLCQAQFLINFHQDRFRQKSSQILGHIVETIENELGNFISKDLSENDTKLMHHLSHTFAIIIYREVQTAIEHVENVGTFSRTFAEQTFVHLNMAASTVVKGLHLSRKATREFIINLMKDLAKVEASGLFNSDFKKIFDSIIEMFIAEVEYKVMISGDPIFNTLNDTLERIVGHLQDNNQNPREFFLHILEKTAWKVKSHIKSIANLANDFLLNVSKINEEAFSKSLEFFRPFHKQLGKVWIELRDLLHHKMQILWKHTHQPCPTQAIVA